VRPVVIAGVGGLVLGHILWLIGITFATRSASRSTWVLAVSGLVVVGAVAAIYLAWQRYQRGDFTRAAFLAALPVAPMIFTTVVLGVTYL
jgi:multidrug resistance efflux pump